MARQSQSQYGPFETELNRLLTLRKQQLMTFPNPQLPHTCENECYYESLITYFNFAYMTPELADYLRANARSSDPDKDILAILQKYQDIAPYWMAAHNGETQGESAIQPYQQTHSLFQALALVKKASRAELSKYLDTPIVPVGDLFYIDNLVSTIEAGTDSGASQVTPPTTYIQGDINKDGTVNVLDFTLLSNAFGTGSVEADINGDGIVNILDFTILSNNFGKTG
jgi:hypothetical protein